MDMRINLTAQIQHMAESELFSMIEPDTLARLRGMDDHPEIRAYVIAHEGPAEGWMVGTGRRIMQYFRDAIIRLHDRLAVGTKVFHQHAADTNDHDGRTPIGELVGKSLRVIGDRLHDVAAIYIDRAFRSLPLDVASIEAEVTFTDDGAGQLTALDVGAVTGVALGDSRVERPGFPGATLLATIQAFADGAGGSRTMTLEEVKAAIASLKARPSDLFDAATLAVDPVVQSHVRDEKQTEYEHAKRVETKLAEERRMHEAAVAEYDNKLKESKAALVQNRSKDVLDGLVKERQFTEQQQAFVARNFKGFQSQAADDGALRTDLNRFLDNQLSEFNEVARLLGVPDVKGTADSKGTPSGDKTADHDSAADLTLPENNPLIPAEV